jgi:beta-1,4-N-acetylglucosaminyltransferase
MIVFGSGGHTSEMLMMLCGKDNQFDFTKYKEVQFVIGKSDTWSYTKIKDFFSKGFAKGTQRPFDIEKDVNNLRVIRLFRSREVKQSYITSIATTLWALLDSIIVVAMCRPDIVNLLS